jgi:hypothetical protein
VGSDAREARVCSRNTRAQSRGEPVEPGEDPAAGDIVGSVGSGAAMDPGQVVGPEEDAAPLEATGALSTAAGSPRGIAPGAAT